MGLVTGMPRNAKTKAASSGWFELDPIYISWPLDKKNRGPLCTQALQRKGSKEEPAEGNEGSEDEMKKEAVVEMEQSTNRKVFSR